MPCLGGNIRDVKGISKERTRWFGVNRRHKGKFVPRNNRVGDSIGLELSTLRLCLFNIISPKIVGLDEFVPHAMALGNGLDVGRVGEVRSIDRQRDLPFWLCTEDISPLEGRLPHLLILVHAVL